MRIIKKQIIVYNPQKFIEHITKKNYKNIFIVCGHSALNSELVKELKENIATFYLFSEFSPNPKYEEVENGLKIFNENKCDCIIAIGGGSAIDVAKSIKAFAKLDNNKNYLEQQIKENNIFFYAVPTTAGTGSESTHFAVIYYKNKKYSVAHQALLPDFVLLDEDFLKSLPEYQKKSTMLDALCQGIESYWSVNATEESKKFAQKAITIILNNYQEYIKENSKVYLEMLKAANYSGRAINISKTTAAHAMSYKITSLYGLSHGHAVAAVLPHIWKYMMDFLEINSNEEVESIFKDLYNIFNVNNGKEALEKINQLYTDIGLEFEHIVKKEDLDILTESVNAERLKNNPIVLNEKCIKEIYKKLI